MYDTTSKDERRFVIIMCRKSSCNVTIIVKSILYITSRKVPCVIHATLLSGNNAH